MNPPHLDNGSSETLNFSERAARLSDTSNEFHGNFINSRLDMYVKYHIKEIATIIARSSRFETEREFYGKPCGRVTFLFARGALTIAAVANDDGRTVTAMVIKAATIIMIIMTIMIIMIA